MRIGILGSGLMGGKLGTIFAKAGHHVVFSYSRDEAKLERLARQAGKRASAGAPADAVRGADAVLLAVHWSRVNDVLRRAGKLSGKVVISCSLPMSKDDSHLVVGHTSSGAEAIAKKVPGAQVVSAFSTAPSEIFVRVFESRKKRSRPDLVFCSNSEKAKRIAARLIRQVGFHPVDLGGLEAARYVEPFALLLAEIAYRGSTNGRLAYRLEHLGPQAH